MEDTVVDDEGNPGLFTVSNCWTLRNRKISVQDRCFLNDVADVSLQYQGHDNSTGIEQILSLQILDANATAFAVLPCLGRGLTSIHDLLGFEIVVGMLCESKVRQNTS